jgi:hypothetical protein
MKLIGQTSPQDYFTDPEHRVDVRIRDIIGLFGVATRDKRCGSGTQNQYADPERREKVRIRSTNFTLGAASQCCRTDSQHKNSCGSGK